MKKLIMVFLAVIFLVLILPLAVICLIGGMESNEVIEETQTSETVSVYIADKERTEDMNISDYLKCVVAAEMPADFEKEALKAQAVAARTYLYSHIEEAKKGNIAERHNGAAVCTDSAHCQAYITEEKCLENWGDGAGEKWDKISSAVDETAGQIMTYEGEIISAVFHSTSSGTTEAAVDVWGSDIPYLQSVASVGDEQSPKYNSSLTVSEDEFRNTIDEKIDGTDWSKGLAENIVRSDAGGIVTIDVGGVTIKGTELRSIFSLRSTNVDIIQNEGNVTMSVKGFGHGVGMSQYGANYLAQQGEDYKQILQTYYTGVNIETK